MTATSHLARDTSLGGVIRTMSALLLGVSVLSMGSGAMLAVIGVRLSSAGASTMMIGAVMSAFFLGELIGSMYGGRVIGRVGHIRAFAVFAAIGAVATLMLALIDSLPVWTLLRFVAGYCIAGLSMIAESWLNHRATNATRGRTLSVYIIAVSAAFALGPLALNLADPNGNELIVAVGILFVLALLPVALTRTGNPEIGEQRRLSLRRLFAIAPMGVLGALTVGLVESTFFGLGAVYGASIGLSPALVSVFLSVSLGGLLVMQFPIGALSDRFDRERVILVITLIAGAAALAVAVIGTMSFALLLALTFVMGGLSSPLYPLALAEANDYLETDELVPAAGAILLAYSMGATAGPLAASALMALVGPAGLYGFIAVVLFAFGIYAAHRVRQGLAKPVDQQTEFQPAMSHATPLAAGLDPRGPEDPAYDTSWEREESEDDGKGWS